MMRTPPLIVALVLSGVALASPLTDTTPYDHPLLDPDVQQMVGQSGLTTEEALEQLQVSWGVEVDESGEVEYSATAEWVQTIPSATPATTDPAETQELWIGDSLQGYLDDPTTAPAVIQVIMTIDRHAWDNQGSYQNQLDIAMLEGEVETVADAHQVRLDFAEDRADALEQPLGTLTTLITSLGGTVTDVADTAGLVAADVSITALQALVSQADIVSIDEDVDDEPMDGGWTLAIDGPEVDLYELTDMIQSSQFYDRNHHGEDQTPAIIEGGAWAIRDIHPGFKGRYSSPRLLQCDTSSSCTHRGVFIGGESHATGVAGILAGDTTLGQDGSLSLSGTETDERSGVARRSILYAVESDYGHRTVEDILVDNGILFANKSEANAQRDPKCKGKDSHCRFFNSLYEGGLALFNAAGNSHHNDENDCTVNSPATAIGVFTVGAWDLDSDENESLRSSTSRGGTTTEGRGRTIVDIAANTNLIYRYQSDSLAALVHGEYAAPDGDESIGGTSAATPVVTGSAALLREWWLDTYAHGIDDPGMLYTNLLLMGDRTGVNGKITTGFDNTWGAGKLRLRAWDSEGMDSPLRWNSGSSCVDEDSDVLIQLSTHPMSADVDELRAVIWWYDPRHDHKSTTDDIKLYMQEYRNFHWDDMTGAVDTSSDNKKRIHLENSDINAGSYYRLRIDGAEVKSDKTGCGNNSVRVYWAFYYEDSDRDDTDWDICGHVRNDQETHTPSCP